LYVCIFSFDATILVNKDVYIGDSVPSIHTQA